MTDPTQSRPFIIQAFDRGLWCPVLESRLLAAVEQIRKLLGPCADDDPALNDVYTLDATEVAELGRKFGVALADDVYDDARFDLYLFSQPEPSTIPYLVHTGFELPLLLDGVKAAGADVP